MSGAGKGRRSEIIISVASASGALLKLHQSMKNILQDPSRIQVKNENLLLLHFMQYFCHFPSGNSKFLTHIVSNVSV